KARWFDPSVDGDRLGCVQCGARWDDNTRIEGRIERERLPHHTRGKRRPVLQRAVVTVLNIIRIPISRPPADHICGRRSACSALACTACIVDRLNFCLIESTIEILYLVGKAIEAVI